MNIETIKESMVADGEVITWLVNGKYVSNDPNSSDCQEVLKAIEGGIVPETYVETVPTPDELRAQALKQMDEYTAHYNRHVALGEDDEAASALGYLVAKQAEIDAEYPKPE